MSSRYVIGIDLGTTNSALAYVDTEADAPEVRVMPIPQVVQPGAVEDRPLLASFVYLPGQGEQPDGAMKLPWDPKRDYAIGEFARSFGGKVPTRLVSSAKSWLCHSGVDRKAAILPFRAGEADRKMSPLEASSKIVRHLAEAWNAVGPGQADPAYRFEEQEIVLTVPASFDAAARELTVEAVREAGIVQLTLLEEPQSAFYAWLSGQGDAWRQTVHVGDLVLVVDVGGGTTDLTLIEVGEEAGNLVLTRLAVGEHLMLGGDNMDLTLAHTVAAALAGKGTKLDAGQMLQLTHAARQAKEQLLADPKLTSAPVTVLGKGRSVVGSSIKHDLGKADVERVLIDGFFPKCQLSATPLRSRSSGLQELGLPYVSDPAITKHLADFVNRQSESLSDRKPTAKGKGATQAAALPTAVLFNGGVFKAGPLRSRLVEVLNDWAQDKKAPAVRDLAGADLDLAVARGAAYYGLVRRGKGVRIRGGTARAYYVGVESAIPAVPGMAPPLKAVCVAPFGMEEGTETDVPGQEFGAIVGEEVEFRFLGSTVRRDDQAGTVVEEWEGQIDELTPVRVTLEAEKGDKTTPAGGVVPVHLHGKVTEVGQLELWLISRDGRQRWKLSFDVRERQE